jgi:hypothetical protein
MIQRYASMEYLDFHWRRRFTNIAGYWSIPSLSRSIDLSTDPGLISHSITFLHSE